MATGLMLGSCSSDWLEVTPPASMPIEEYYNTAEHVEEAAVAAYAPLQWTDWTEQYNPINIMSDIMADQIWVGGADKTDNQFWHLMMNYEAIPTNCMSALWSDAYSGIKRCNDCITYLSWAKDMKESRKVELEAQMRVLRVYYYNWLWKFWGNVPYYEKNLEDPYLKEQSTADEVYAAMMADLKGAIELNALPETCTGTDNQGRVTKAMAYMLYAEIAMYQNTDEAALKQAFTYMNEIISGGKYALNPDYTTIFTEAGEWTSESIFEVNYKDDNAARSWSNTRYSGGTVLPTLIGPSGWTAGADGHDDGWGFAPVRTETFEMFAEGDTRRDATCWHATGSYNARYQDTGYFLEKYCAHTGDNADQIADAQLNHNENLRVYRYAECLLNAAELAVRGYGQGDAKAWLNMVHKRAGLTDQVDATMDNIKQERRLEFVGEGKRYWDLVRWGDASSVLTPDKYGYRTNTWSESRKYLPIPQSEIDAAYGTLKQNPGY